MKYGKNLEMKNTMNANFKYREYRLRAKKILSFEFLVGIFIIFSGIGVIHVLRLVYTHWCNNGGL